ncbi:hypothetical protein [Noviherbaspirillum cavernae]|uniref:hypothetical protein n=1 Tax=Noviherbaspirillum cavernae TaxID=2320862 RepID=UPI0018F2D22D|nr:hypothetical protein [Noviherbaspirillum cavernae]
MTAQGRAVGHVESAFPGFRKAGAGSGYDDGVSHLMLLELDDVDIGMMFPADDRAEFSRHDEAVEIPEYHSFSTIVRKYLCFRKAGETTCFGRKKPVPTMQNL